jgi:two-component system cell cycle sensor histidine kinase/response regulator CckA
MMFILVFLVIWTWLLKRSVAAKTKDLHIELTERKRTEEENIRVNKSLTEHEKLSLVGQVAGKMAHDFNNILGIIMGNTELALVDCQNDQTKKRLELIFNQTIRGRNLTKNLVAFAKDQEPKQEFFSINEKMDLVLNLLKMDLEGINVIRPYSHGMPPILADSGMIEHAIVNLVQNSIHAVSLIEQPEIKIHTYHQGELIFIEIEDNGCGIPPEFIGEIYEPSFTLKGNKDKAGMYKPDIRGTGYGMSNVKKYIEQHKGNISIHSELQKGTKITINLPVIKKELTDEEIKKVKKETISFEKYILIVEDEQDISDIQYNILTHEPCNHKVDIADNGQVALDLLNRNEYDLISLDYVLPGKYNGMDVYHQIRETNQTIPVLFISGNIEFLESIKNLKKKDSYIDHLSKPCKNIDYLNGINKLFANRAI